MMMVRVSCRCLIVQVDLLQKRETKRLGCIKTEMERRLENNKEYARINEMRESSLIDRRVIMLEENIDRKWKKDDV